MWAASVLAVGLLVPAGVLGSMPASAAPARAAAARPGTTALSGVFVGSISCATVRMCMAVGFYQVGTHSLPLAMDWNGKKWAVQRLPVAARTDGSLDAVSGHSPVACTAVGQSFPAKGAFTSSPLVERWNGKKWAFQQTARPLPAHGSIFSGVACTSAASCTAVGYSEFDEDEAGKPLAEHWNGRRWAFQRVPTTVDEAVTLASVSCTSARSCTAVGQSAAGDESETTLAEHWNGKRWAIQPTPAPPLRVGFSGLSAVSCTSTKACLATGDSQDNLGESQDMLAERWNGHRWSVRHVSNQSGQKLSMLSDLSCSSAVACTAVGGSGSVGLDPGTIAVAGQWNGTDWTVRQVANPAGATGSGLTDVSCRGAVTCLAVGAYQDASLVQHSYLERWNGKRWTFSRLPS